MNNENIDFQNRIFIQVQNIIKKFESEIDNVEYKHEFTNDDELVIYRESDNGVSNLIICDETCIALSFINIKNKKLDKLKFYSDEDDLESIVLEFFKN